MMRYIFTCLLIAAVSATFAQSKNKKTKVEESSAGQATSLAPNYTQKEYEPKKKKKVKGVKGKVTYSARDNFYDRMEALEKANRKSEKEMAKPQYSDPMYFGHKRPPKKRPINKMRYCKVCGIRH